MALPWSDLPFLLALARAGTLSATARMLKLDRTTIARRIGQLEESLGEALFDRLDGRYSLTPYGRRIFAAAESAEQDLLFLEQSADGRRELIAQGFGVGILPRYFADRDPRIECCSGPLPDAGFTLFIVLRPEQQKLARMRQFVDHVFHYLTRLPGLDTAVSLPAEHRNG